MACFNESVLGCSAVSLGDLFVESVVAFGKPASGGAAFGNGSCFRCKDRSGASGSSVALAVQLLGSGFGGASDVVRSRIGVGANDWG